MPLLRGALFFTYIVPNTMHLIQAPPAPLCEVGAPLFFNSIPRKRSRVFQGNGRRFGCKNIFQAKFQTITAFRANCKAAFDPWRNCRNLWNALSCASLQIRRWASSSWAPSSAFAPKLDDDAKAGQRKDVQPMLLTVPIEPNPQVIPRENGFDTHRLHS